MRKISVAALVILALAVALLAGCGGGGGSSNNNNPNPDPDPPANDRLITGTVVSSTDNTTGVRGVTVRFGDYIYATSDANGKFTLSIPSDNKGLPYYYEVDTTGAGPDYPAAELITLSNGQTYNPKKVDMPIGILNAATNSLGTIIVRRVTDTELPGSPYDSHDTILYGRVVTSRDGKPVSGVTIRFGTSVTKTATTGAKGYFALNLGLDVLPITMFEDPGNAMFSINSSTAGPSYPSTLNVSYMGDNFTQSAIRVPREVISRGSTDLNDITLMNDGSGGDDNPPPPPIDDYRL